MLIIYTLILIFNGNIDFTEECKCRMKVQNKSTSVEILVNKT